MLPRAEQKNTQDCRRISLQPPQQQRSRGGAAERSLNIASRLKPAVEAAAPQARAAAKTALKQRQLRWMRVKSAWNSWRRSLGQPGGKRPYERKRKRWRRRQHYSGALQ
jgi:hypothetical protein